jgi:hypothetical protein
MSSLRKWFQSSAWKMAFGPGIYFTLMTIVMTWQLPLHMGDAIVGQIGDNIYFVWLIGWFRKALFELHVSPVFVPFLNYPEGWSLAHTEITPATILMALPASLIGGNIFAYNLVLLASFVLTGLATYYWINHLTQNKMAGLIAGTIFAFLPYRIAHFLSGHLNLMGTQWFPLYFWGLYELLSLKRWSWKPVWLAGISFGLIALTSQYYLYMAVLGTVLFAAVYLLFFNRAQIFRLEFWKLGGVTFLIALPLLVIAVVPFLQLNSQGELSDRNISSLKGFSSSPMEYILPATDHFLWGRWIMLNFNRLGWQEGSLYIGVISGALALYALAVSKKGLKKHRTLMILLMLVGILAFLLSLGPEIRWPEVSRLRGLPRVLQPILNPLFQHSFSIRAPGYYFIRYLPFFAKMRAWQRFGILFLLSVSVLAGLGSSWLLGRVKTWQQKWLTILLLALIFLDFYPGPYTEFAQPRQRALDTWLAAQPGDGAVAVFPFDEEADQLQVYYTLFYNKPFLGGFFNAFAPAQNQRIGPVLGDFPTMAGVALLRDLKVKYVIMDKSRYPNFAETQTMLETLGLYPVNDLDGQAVFILPEN